MSQKARGLHSNLSPWSRHHWFFRFSLSVSCLGSRGQIRSCIDFIWGVYWTGLRQGLKIKWVPLIHPRLSGIPVGCSPRGTVHDEWPIFSPEPLQTSLKSVWQIFNSSAMPFLVRHDHKNMAPNVCVLPETLIGPAQLNNGSLMIVPRFYIFILHDRESRSFSYLSICTFRVSIQITSWKNTQILVEVVLWDYRFEIFPFRRKSKQFLRYSM